jgi:hypothetical protein
MAALNQAETQVLRDVQSLLDYIARNGYDPEKGTAIKSGSTVGFPLKDKIKDAKSALNMVTQMKGYYPK